MPTQNDTHAHVHPRAHAETIDTHREWKLLLAAVECLHGRGLTGLRAIPHHGPVGYWRFAVTHATNLTGGVRFPARDDDAVFAVSAGGFPTVGTLEVGPETTADRVADEILRHLGSPAQVTAVDDAGYVEWFSHLRRRADELDQPPAAFSDSGSGWCCGETAIDPPPGWVEA